MINNGYGRRDNEVIKKNYSVKAHESTPRYVSDFSRSL